MCLTLTSVEFVVYMTAKCAQQCTNDRFVLRFDSEQVGDVLHSIGEVYVKGMSG